jgi:flagellar protein FlaG
MSASIPPFNAPPTATSAYGSPGSGVAPDARSLQRFLDNASAGTQLKFRVDSDAGRVVVQVLDAQSGEVLRQIPRDEALTLARNSLDARTQATPQVLPEGEDGRTSVRV